MLQYVDYTLKYKIPILHEPYRSQEKGMLLILKTSCNILTSKRHYYRQYVILKKKSNLYQLPCVLAVPATNSGNQAK